MEGIEKVSAVRLKKGLSKIKKNVNEKFGAVWKLRKDQVINKIRNLNYKYNQQTQTLKTNSMIRKPSTIKL
tara:strand:+ start:510 stop:722 length:213 start_codon:yes stop_codon:yes gene_type:complete